MESEQGIFWGIILKPDKRYESVVEEDFRVTKACVDTTTLETGKVATVILEKGNEEFILCNLNGPSNYDSNMDLAFTSGEKICFKIEGSATVHLTGCLMPDDDVVPDDSMMMGDSMFDTTEDGEEVEDEESDSEEEEAPQLVNATNGKRKLQDQDRVDSPKQSAKKAKKEVKQAEAMKKILSEDKKQQDEDDDDSDDDDENDETMDADMDDLEEEEESEDEDDGEEEEESEEEETPTPKKETPKKDKKKEKLAENGDTPAKTNGQATAAKKETPAKPPKEEPALTPKAAKGIEKQATETPKSKKKDKRNKNKEKNAAEGSTPAKQGDAAKPASPTKTPKPQKMTLKGGIVAEDLRVGNGPEAKAGKHVGMYYKGILTKSGKQFDAQLQGKPFKFKLGKGEVIKGWDVGVEGMKVGGKRKLTIPPHMAYGKDGAGPDIPPNASLTFEVECKMVN